MGIEKVVKGISRGLLALTLATTLSCTDVDKKELMVQNDFDSGVNHYEQGEYLDSSIYLWTAYNKSGKNPYVGMNFADALERLDEQSTSGHGLRNIWVRKRADKDFEKNIDFYRGKWIKAAKWGVREDAEEYYDYLINNSMMQLWNLEALMKYYDRHNLTSQYHETGKDLNRKISRVNYHKKKRDEIYGKVDRGEMKGVKIMRVLNEDLLELIFTDKYK